VNVRAIKIAERISATVRVPGSKSLTNRALICAALAQGQSVLHNASDSHDTALLVNGLNQMGVLARRSGNQLIVEGTGGKLYAPKFPIPVGNAGTTLRFLLSLAALANGATVFECDVRMSERPMDALLNVLRQSGVDVGSQGTRISVRGGGLNGGEIEVNASKSSQFVSSLLLASPNARKDVVLSTIGAVSSASFSAMTVEVMRSFGVNVEVTGNTYRIRSPQRYVRSTFHVEPDASGASYFLASAVIAGGTVTVQGLKTPSLQGDMGFVNVLEAMGNKISLHESGVQCEGAKKLNGVDVDMNSMPDVAPTLVATALFAEGPTRIRNVAHLQFKESDRLNALATELKKTGADIAVVDGGLEVHPADLHGARLDTHDDHRLAMSFSLIGLKVPGIEIENPTCVVKSFPKFWEEFEKLYT